MEGSKKKRGSGQVYAVVVVTASEHKARKLGARSQFVHVSEPWPVDWDDKGLDTIEIIRQRPEADS